MKRKQLAVVGYVSGILMLVVALAVGFRSLHLHPIAIVGIAWFLGLVAGLFAGALAMRIWPETEKQTNDGWDWDIYPHLPMHFVIRITLLAVVLGVALAIMK